MPDTEWLTGAPVLGTVVLPLRSTDTVHERAQRFRCTLPPGSESLELPLELPATVQVGDSAETQPDGPSLTLAQPLPEPTEVEVVTAPTAVLRGGSAWRGPVRVRTAPAQLPLGDWQLLGLGGWSGGVTYAGRSRFLPGRTRCWASGGYAAACRSSSTGSASARRSVLRTAYNSRAPQGGWCVWK
ncbi:hypothetical protein OG226_05280 [Streptomyces sp. NBC_01261]|nr:hypothetical protein [Streptomyces sp. NBC_01261]